MRVPRILRRHADPAPKPAPLTVVQEPSTANPGAATVAHHVTITTAPSVAPTDVRGPGRVRYAARIEVWKADNGRWYGHRRASNGKITDPTQGYSRRRGVLTWAARTFPDLAVINRPPPKP